MDLVRKAKKAGALSGEIAMMPIEKP